MSHLELDTALQPLSNEQGSGRYAANLSRDWEIWGPNGGYLAAIALRAAGKVTRLPRPVSLHVHYLRVAQFSEVTLDVRVLHAGRQAESIAVQMEQAGKLVLTALVRTAHEGDGLEHDAAAAPQVEGPDALPVTNTLWKADAPRFPFWDNFDRRALQPEVWDMPREPLPPRWLEWFRYKARPESDCAFLNAGLSTILIDTLCWPAAWLTHGDERYIAPSLDLTVWFHRRADSDWLLADAHAPLAERGIIGGSCSIWNERAQLIASGGSQLMCVKRG